jgi:hypothetical protein
MDDDLRRILAQQKKSQGNANTLANVANALAGQTSSDIASQGNAHTMQNVTVAQSQSQQQANQGQSSEGGTRGDQSK